MVRSVHRRTLEVSIPVHESLKARAAQLDVPAAQLASHLLAEALGGADAGLWHIAVYKSVKADARAARAARAATAPSRAAVAPQTPDPVIPAPRKPAPVVPSPSPSHLKRAEQRRQAKHARGK